MQVQHKQLLLERQVFQKLSDIHMKHRYIHHKGFGLVEVIIGITIISVSVVAIMGVFQKALSVSGRSLHVTQASFLAEEGAEVLKALRDESWAQNIDVLNTDTRYFLTYATSSSSWSLTTATQTIDSFFYRWIVFEDVYRNSTTDDIDTVGTLDSNTKKMTVSVVWQDRGSTSTHLFSTYITNLFEN